MHDTAEVTAARDALLAHFRWRGGHADRDRVLLVDDWAERGSQAAAVQQLVASTGTTFAGVSLLVGQLGAEARAGLGRVTSLAGAADLGDPDE